MGRGLETENANSRAATFMRVPLMSLVAPDTRRRVAECCNRRDWHDVQVVPARVQVFQSDGCVRLTSLV